MKFIVAVTLLLSLSLSAQSIKDKAESDDVVYVQKDDSQMLAAFDKARNSLDSFLDKLSTAKNKQEYFLKVGLRNGDDVEYFWMGNLETVSGNTFSGVLGNQPRLVTGYSLGDVIQFERKDIFDWMYMEGGKMHGNFTTCVLLQKESIEQQEAFKQAYGLQCD